jgi:phospholipid-binding lipoprotein MlaA
MLTFVFLLCPAFLWAGTSSPAADVALSHGPESLATPQSISGANSDTGGALQTPLGFTPAEVFPIPLRQSSQLPDAYPQNDEAMTVLTQAEGEEAPAAAPVENETIAEEGEKETPQIPDPLAPLNKAMFQFNDKLYFWVLKPTTQVYSHIVPEPVRILVSNFYDNLWAPSRIINNLLQLRFKAAGNELIRFIFNSFAGIGGIGEVATPALGIKKQEADFGQTLGHYGVGQGFYLVLPILGPSSLRDGIGLVGDEFMYPITYWSLYGNLTFWEAAGFFVHEKVNDTSFKIGDYESFKESAIDPYISMRDAFTQYRQNKVEESKQ